MRNGTEWKIWHFRVFIILLWAFEYNQKVVEALLLFPAASVLQITASLAVPVELPGRKLYMDWGYQFNWELPWNPASFYNVKTFEDAFSRKARTLEDNFRGTQNMSMPRQDMTKYTNSEDKIHAHDFTAGELYASMENTLVRYGLHETCLLRSVCELARHPFDDQQQNLITELLTFLLTPSLHEGFSATESVYRSVYEEAERNGFLGHECASLYADCKQDILSGMTRIVFGNESLVNCLCKYSEARKYFTIVRICRHCIESRLQVDSMWAIISILIVEMSTQQVAGLLYPINSVLQIQPTLSVPVSHLPPLERITFDWGFQMNYNAPHKLTELYSTPIWSLVNDDYERHARDLNTKNLTTSDRPSINGPKRHQFDYTAGELYRALQRLLVNHGFQAACLERAICELARHPFADQNRNLLTELVTFLLSPSWHRAFASCEWELRESFEAAELRGFLGESCGALYADCRVDLLNVISKVIILK